MSDFNIKNNAKTHEAVPFLRWSPMLDFPRSIDRNMVLSGPLRHTLHAIKDRFEQRGFPLLNKFDSRGFKLSENVTDYGGLFKRYPKASLLEDIKPYLIHIDTTIDPTTKEDVIQCSAWRFTILTEPRFVRGRMQDVKVDMTVVINDKNEVVTAILTDKDDYTFHNKQIYASHETRADLLTNIIFKQTLNQIRSGNTLSLGFGDKGRGEVTEPSKPKPTMTTDFDM